MVYAENGESEADSFITPPDLHELTDEDLGYENELEETRRYALAKNCPDPKIIVDERKCFTIILMISGYNELPGKRYYWASEDDMRNRAVYKAMKRNKFFKIMRFLNFQNNNKLSLC
ncbi:hypothetical protein ILUMI_20538 [Ignelater luminosus]|uniref:PiggyBac transposable element-derived protein domain-containing protein n=1 Tax=Ignelater luminosus TaxID=2038154 RepID=A0A8K0CJI3_IGNLU|nr:hypothetical protein ILUMI_20538 [Ignelater luminosus]